MFSALDEKEKDIVIDAMAEHKFQKGDKIIKQGDDGEVLYVVDSGILSCYKLFVFLK
jgi:cAMP-dependent protein kinase regulator